MIKNILKISGVMILLITAGAYSSYKLLGSLSGQDAICISGILAGIFVGLWQGKLKGISAAVSVLISAALICIPLVVLSLFIALQHHDLVESLAFFSIGFSMLFFYIAGALWSKR